jgi:DNA-binding GntR family transcriptional regulator
MPKIPRYREIADDLRARLADPGPHGLKLEPGAKFPTISELQEEYEVPGLNTVRQALAILIDEGLLESVHGRGTFVRALPMPSGDGGRAALRTDLLDLQAALGATQTALARVLRHLDDTEPGA